MNRFAYRTTGLAIKTLENLSRAKVRLHDAQKLPDGNIIFVINHFTRLETILMPYHIFKLTGVPVWSLAAPELFKGSLGAFLDTVGAVSTRNPDRDRLVVRSLLSGEAGWIIFPEGRMVKNQKIIEKGRFMISYAGGKHPPHTGAATLALRTEFYRRRLLTLAASHPEEAERLLALFKIEGIDAVSEAATFIVPVNITYYPVRARENILSRIAAGLVEDLPERLTEELMTEGSMLLTGVDMDIRFGDPIDVGPYVQRRVIRRDMTSGRRIDFEDVLPSKRAMRRAALEIMQRYMRAIYDLTTVNFDHLFASILKMLKYKQTNDLDLRRRVYLAVTGNLAGMGLNLHDSLTANPAHLLTDDRFGRFRDFAAVALETGALRRKGRALVKDFNKFQAPFDFHRIRIENPVAVMANAVEPLVPLQRCVRRLGWLPAFWIRRQTARRLLSEALRAFETDYAAFYAEGESQKKTVGRPLLIRGRSRDLGVVLCHGYMAAPQEVRELADYLGRQGVWVYCPRLKGHGTSPDDLATRSYPEWVASVEEGYGIVSSLCRRVVLGGFSTGAGLALDLAARLEGISGVFAVSTPLRLQYLGAKFVPAVDAWNRLMKRVGQEGAQKEFVENHPENPHINYRRNPIAGVRELERLMDDLEPRLPAVNVPALVVQSDGDPVVDPRGSKKIFDRLGSEDKTYLLFNFDRHGILLGPGAHRVHRAIGDFIDHLRREA